MRTLLFLLVILSITVRAQVSTEQPDFYTLSLEELMSIPVSVASKTELTIRESPAILSVISGEEIRNLGARDIMDILNLVPGFGFGMDVQGIVGIGSRGNWAHEGKILVLLDGQEMNEILYSTVAFGQHFDVAQIDKIEIIRGPGSSIYGGYAELGVINIVSKSGGKLKGVEVTGNYGFLSDTFARRNISIGVGNKTDNIEYSASAHIGEGTRSNKDYTDVFGTTTNLGKLSGINPAMVNAALKIKDFSARVLWDNYSLETADQYEDIIVAPLDEIDFGAVYGELKYDWKTNDKITITPRVNYKTGHPWRSNKDSPYLYYSVRASRFSPSLSLNWNASSMLNLVAGVDSYFDRGEHNGEDENYFVTSNEVTYSNVGLFAQAHIKNKTLPLFIGARFDNHSQFGAAFSPRIGVTKMFEKWHFKLLYSRAFRAPAIENINTNKDIKPEKTGVAELELGFELTSNMLLTANVFDIQITDPIVYFVDPGPPPTEEYVNFEKAGSRGFELDYRYKSVGNSIGLNFSYYTSKDINEVTLYAVPIKDEVTLAWPSAKVNAYGSFRFLKTLTFSPSITYLAKRYGFTQYDTNNELILEEFNPAIYFNFFVNHNDLFTRGLSLGAGVYDILDEGQLFIQPYANRHSPLPGIGREILVRLSYNLSFERE